MRPRFTIRPHHLAFSRIFGVPTARAAIESPPSPAGRAKASIPEQYAVLVTCRDEAQKIELLRRFHADGLACRALLS